MKLIRYTALLLLLLALSACGTQNSGPVGAIQADFSARPLEKGDGSWELVWDTDANSVTLDGTAVEKSGSLEVIHADPHTYELIARRGNQNVTRSLTLAGVSEIRISAAHDAPLIQEPGSSLQLQAEVLAEGSDVAPSQTVTWSSLKEDVATVDPSTGLVTIHDFGTAEIRASSAQWTDMERGVTVLGELVPEIEVFDASPWLDTGGEWQLNWEVDAERVELNGEPVSATGTRRVAPDAPLDYVLAARNGDATVTSTIRLAPVSSVSIPELREPVRLLIGRPVDLTARVNAAGSEIRPSQEVRWTSSHAQVAVNGGRIVANTDPGETVRITVESLQAPDTRLTFEAIIVDTAVAGFESPGVTFPLVAGTPISLNWTNSGAEALRLVPIVTGNTSRAPQGLDNSAQQTTVEIPQDKGWLNFELQWTDPDGTMSSVLLWDELQPVVGWVCNEVDNDVVTIPDETLRTAIEGLFELTPGSEIRCQDVQRDFPPDPVDGQEDTNLIYYNRCDDNGEPDPSVPLIESLEGLQHLVNLKRLELECNLLEDISRLESMRGLTDLNLDNNLISDLTPLQNLHDLGALGLYNNRVENLAGIENLTNLEILYLSKNRIKDVTPIAGLHNLRLLWLYLNCETDDDINYYNCLSDLSPLTELHNLETLVIHHNSITNLDFISADMDQLQHIQATGNLITTIAPLAGLPSLRTVAVDENYLPDVDALANNVEFPDGEPYEYIRGTAEVVSTIHLALGYNCFVPAEDPGVASLLARDVLIEGLAITSKDPGECSAPPAGLRASWIRLSDTEFIRPGQPDLK